MTALEKRIKDLERRIFRLEVLRGVQKKERPLMSRREQLSQEVRNRILSTPYKGRKSAK